MKESSETGGRATQEMEISPGEAKTSHRESKSQSIDEVLQYWTEAKRIRDELNKYVGEEPSKSLVIWNITRVLLILFGIEVVAFLIVILYLIVTNVSAPDKMEQLLGIVVNVMITILPITTTFLGIALGYYFRKEA